MTKKELIDLLADVKDEEKIEVVDVLGIPFSIDVQKMAARKLNKREFKLCIK